MGGAYYQNFTVYVTIPCKSEQMKSNKDLKISIGQLYISPSFVSKGNERTTAGQLSMIINTTRKTHFGLTHKILQKKDSKGLTFITKLSPQIN